MFGASQIDPAIVHGVIVAMVAVAAFTDVRKGTIGNWLTLPMLVIAPVVYGVVDGAGGLANSLLGMFACAVVPLMIFYRDGMHGGDVKLFAAIGAVGDIYVGLGVEFVSLVVAAVYALGLLVWNGKLGTSLVNTFFVALNPVLPRRYRRPIAKELMHHIRLGAAILLGTLVVLAQDYQRMWVQ